MAIKLDEKNKRTCDCCGTPISEGYWHSGGYYGCSDDCWFDPVDYTFEDYDIDYENGEAGWSEWAAGE